MRRPLRRVSGLVLRPIRPAAAPPASSRISSARRLRSASFNAVIDFQLRGDGAGAESARIKLQRDRSRAFIPPTLAQKHNSTHYLGNASCDDRDVRSPRRIEGRGDRGADLRPVDGVAALREEPLAVEVVDDRAGDRDRDVGDPGPNAVAIGRLRLGPCYLQERGVGRISSRLLSCPGRALRDPATVMIVELGCRLSCRA